MSDNIRGEGSSANMADGQGAVMSGAQSALLQLSATSEPGGRGHTDSITGVSTGATCASQWSLPNGHQARSFTNRARSAAASEGIASDTEHVGMILSLMISRTCADKVQSLQRFLLSGI